MSLRSRAEQLISARSFLRDKIGFLILALGLLGVLILFLWAFHISWEIILTVGFFWLVFVAVALLVEYWRRKKFYHDLAANISNLDQAYLVLETLEMPKFYDGQILYELLYELNKSMVENVKKYSLQSREFQEYVEMWIHEVKTPLATMSLLTKDPKINQQIKQLDDYVEQVLYVVRAENAERDYLVNDVQLANVVGVVANRNREILLAKKIDFVAEDLDYKVCTDGKWLEFILNQIITNSIKYQSSKITIVSKETPQEIILTVRDNGLGISEKDLPRVFDKSFTGSNGRTGKQSTGMGLYIAKTLCEKLGHQITIDSQLGKYTEVKITFAKNNYYKNVI